MKDECSRVAYLLDRYVNGETDDDTDRFINRHLEVCSDCSDVVLMSIEEKLRTEEQGKEKQKKKRSKKP